MSGLSKLLDRCKFCTFTSQHIFMNIRTVLFVGLLFLSAVYLGCNSSKKTSVDNINNLYNIWQIDSVQLSGNIIPNSHLIGGLLKFEKDGKQTVTVGETVEEINFEVKDWKLINLDKPDEEPLTIYSLTKTKLVLAGDEGLGPKIRMVLTSIKK